MNEEQHLLVPAIFPFLTCELHPHTSHTHETVGRLKRGKKLYLIKSLQENILIAGSARGQARLAHLPHTGLFALVPRKK